MESAIKNYKAAKAIAAEYARTGKSGASREFDFGRNRQRRCGCCRATGSSGGCRARIGGDSWRQDLDERKARAVAMEEKRREHLKSIEPKVELSAIGSVLSELDAAADDFEQSYGKPNQPLIDAKIEAERLRFELSAAESKLAEIEARGDSVQRLRMAFEAQNCSCNR